MTEIVIHRGIGVQNTYQGILDALRCHSPCLNPSGVCRCETDLLWHQSSWWICHDFGTLSRQEHSQKFTLSHLLAGIAGMSSAQDYDQGERCLLLDIKWDWIHNREDSWPMAWDALLRILGMCTTPEWRDRTRCSILLQHNHLSLLQMSGDAPFRMGMVMTAPLSLWSVERLRDIQIDFLMIDLAACPEADIRTLRFSMPPNVEIFGYTCPDLDSLGRYTHLIPWLSAIVCDITSAS